MEKTTKWIEMIDLYEDWLYKEDFENLCFSDEEIEQYENWEYSILNIFEGDPDYMIDENWNTTYFIIIWNKCYYANWWYDCDIDKLENFVLSQNPKISIWWFNTRSESDHWKYFEENTWKEFEEYKWLKIAYRWWAWYCYTLFKYE